MIIIFAKVFSVAFCEDQVNVTGKPKVTSLLTFLYSDEDGK